MNPTNIFLLFMVVATSGCHMISDHQTISTNELRDKIMGGWAGKMIGVSYGAPTEFRAKGTTYEEDLHWSPDQVKNSLWQDDLYVQMSFMMTMDRYGIGAPVEKFADSFAAAGYQLWCANVQSRKNYFDGIMPPLSGHPKYNLWADAIDFQIEADYIGFMNPGMPQSANAICDKVGHIMNYGDGVYGGMFVCALYSQAFFIKDIERIIKNALQAIPAQSQYAQCIQDVIALHTEYPLEWRKAWKELEQKWGDTDLSGPLDPFNIDAKINGAYIVMGLLYGEGDFRKTMDITIRCGQDSDCNPSNAAAVLGVRDGYSGIPDLWKQGITAIADSVFIFTDYTFNKVVDRTIEYARELVQRNGGRVDGEAWSVPVQKPLPPANVEISFPQIKPSHKIKFSDANTCRWEGNWVKQETEGGREKFIAGRMGDRVTFSFHGSGIVLTGDWICHGGTADVFVDDQFQRSIDTYYCLNFAGYNDAYLFHVFRLNQGDHTLRVVVNGKKNEQSGGTDIAISGAIVYTKI